MKQVKSGNGASGEILIVDDTPQSLKLLKDLLQEAGYGVRPASSGEVALRSIQAKPPELILLDVRMPDMDGYTVCEQLKADDRTRLIPVIFISALHDEHAKVKGFEVGGVDFITKPFQRHEVLSRVRTHLTLYRMVQNLEGLVAERTAELTARIKHQKQIEAELRQSENRFRTMIEKSPLPTIITDSAHTIHFHNAKFAELFGYTSQQIDTAAKWWQTYFPDAIYRKQVQTKRTAAIAKAARDQSEIDMLEWDVTIKGGNVRHCEVYTVPLDEYLLVIINDITKRKQMEAELRQAQKMEAVGVLAGGIAHDFNNILAAIIGNTELAIEDVPAGVPVNDLLQETLMAGKRARDLVKQILAYARPSDKAVFPVPISSILNEAIKLLRPTIPTSIEIRYNIDSNALVMADPSMLHQIIMNLCTNAYHAMEESGGVLQISLAEVTFNETFTANHQQIKPGDYLKLTITDTGVGIPVEIQSTIFDPFFTTKEPHQGTGMGLAVVYGIVKNYGGAIAMASEPGQGAQFTVYLPMILRKDAPIKLNDTQLPRGSEHILLVDDERPIAKLQQQILQRLGYTVESCTSSAEALTRFESNPQTFDLVITDMTMPQMTGDVLARKLISIRADIPVILCTGYSSRISEEKITQIGIKALARKPIERHELAQTVRKALDEGKPHHY